MKKNNSFIAIALSLIYITQPSFSTIKETIDHNITQEDSLISCQNSEFSPIKTLMIVIGDDPLLKKIARINTFDLTFTDQLIIEIKRAEEELNKKTLEGLFNTQDISLCITLKTVKQHKDSTTVLVKVQETDSGKTIIQQKFSCSPKTLIQDSHKISKTLLWELTKEQSVCLSSLAYCKQYGQKDKAVCISDYACFTEHILIRDKTLNVAPSWHPSADCIFYSHFTRKNAQLKCFDFNYKKSRVICAYDGINMQPSCSNDGKQVVMSMSSAKGNSEIYLYDQKLCQRAGKRVFKELTHNGGCNVSPCLLPDGNLIFCSDFQTSTPQIYHLEMKSNKIKRITNGKGNCSGPSYNAQQKFLVYSRLVNKDFQLFSIDLESDTIRERQLTSNKGDKLDPCWSPCGRYVAFTYDYVDADTKKRIPQVAILNYYSGKIRILTKSPTPKSFVSWTAKTHYYY